MSDWSSAAATSLELGAIVAAVAGALGAAFAWLVARTDLPGRGRLGSLLALPYAIPAYLLGMAWVVLGNPTVGLFRGVLPSSGSYGFWGIALVESSVAFAFPFLELRAGFERLDPALEEAARMSGASPWRVFRDVSFPLLWPALLNGMCLAFLYALSSFGVPALLGLPVRLFTLTTLIYSELKLGGADGIARGLWVSGALLVLACSGLALSSWAGRVALRRSGPLSGGKASRLGLVRLGAWRYVALGALLGLLGVGVALPWAALGLEAFAPVSGSYALAGWTLRNIAHVLELADFRSAVVNSAFLAAGMATAVSAGGFLLAYAAVRLRSRVASWTALALGVPFATPGTVLAMALVFFGVVISRVGVPALPALVLIAASYGLKYAAVGARSMITAFRQVDPALEEAARISGARRLELLLTIWAPLLKRTWLAAWWLAALPMATELTMSVLLTGPGAETLGTVLFDLHEYASQPQAAALAWLLLTLAIVCSFWAGTIAREVAA